MFCAVAADSAGGVCPGASFQVYSGTTPQIYRICKGEPLRGGDCDVEIRNESNAQLAVFEKQPLNSCACTDVEGKKIVVEAIASPSQACTGVSTTIWFSHVRQD